MATHFACRKKQRDAEKVAYGRGHADAIAQAGEIAKQSALRSLKQETDNVRPNDLRYQHKAITVLEIERKILALSPNASYLVELQVEIVKLRTKLKQADKEIQQLSKLHYLL